MRQEHTTIIVHIAHRGEWFLNLENFFIVRFLLACCPTQYLAKYKRWSRMLDHTANQ